MNRQHATQLHLSPVHLQQAMFAVLALLITLIGGQQYLSWQLSQQQEGPSVSFQHPVQTHFSAANSGVVDTTSMRMMDIDQLEAMDQTPRQERWVF